jgi:hypothetical protein
VVSDSIETYRYAVTKVQDGETLYEVRVVTGQNAEASKSATAASPTIPISGTVISLPGLPQMYDYECRMNNMDKGRRSIG